MYLKNPNGSYYSAERLPDLINDRSPFVSFKASDRRTTVFLKLSVRSEFPGFVDYFKKIHRKISDETKQRTKSLPTRIPDQEAQLKLFSVDEIKRRRISKRDISKPFNFTHSISVKPSDKPKFYTLSKLLK